MIKCERNHTFSGCLWTTADKIDDKVGISLKAFLLPSRRRKKLEESSNGRRVARERCLIELLAEYVEQFRTGVSECFNRREMGVCGWLITIGCEVITRNQFVCAMMTVAEGG